MATVALPRLLKGVELPPEPSHQREEDRSPRRRRLGRPPRHRGRRPRHGRGQADPDLYADIASRIMELYRQRIESRTRTDDDDVETSRRLDEIERQLRLAGLAAERDELGRLMRARQIDEETGRKLIREIDLQELRYV